MKLATTHLQCQSCGRRFDGRNAFDLHKDRDRRCIAVNEHAEHGLVLVGDVWRTAEPVYRIGVRE